MLSLFCLVADLPDMYLLCYCMKVFISELLDKELCFSVYNTLKLFLNLLSSLCVCSLGLSVHWVVRLLILCLKVFYSSVVACLSFCLCCCLLMDMIWFYLSLLLCLFQWWWHFLWVTFQDDHSIFYSKLKSDMKIVAWSLIIMNTVLYVGWLILDSDVEEDWWRKEEYKYSFNDGFLILQLSPRPQSSMYYFIISVEWQSHELPEILELSIVGLITVLKFPAFIIFVSHTVRRKRCGNRMGHHYWGCKCWLAMYESISVEDVRAKSSEVAGCSQLNTPLPLL